MRYPSLGISLAPLMSFKPLYESKEKMFEPLQDTINKGALVDTRQRAFADKTAISTSNVKHRQDATKEKSPDIAKTGTKGKKAGSKIKFDYCCMQFNL